MWHFPASLSKGALNTNRREVICFITAAVEKMHKLHVQDFVIKTSKFSLAGRVNVSPEQRSEH